MRRQVEDRRAVAGDDVGLAALDLAGKLGQAVLRLTDRHRFHKEIVAACGYNLQCKRPRLNALALSRLPLETLEASRARPGGTKVYARSEW